MARDDFASKTIETLKARVAHRCSNPDCRVPTSAPSNNQKVNNIGVAAHICAASPGGPRYDSNMSAEERKSIDNAIWLCSNCSIDIDRDTNRYSAEKLKDWKNQAEEAARAELGKKLPGKGDAIDTVTAALTGLPKTYLADAISNVHQASQRSLENLDPRFQVMTAYRDGTTSIGIYAKENVECSMRISGDSVRHYLEKYQLLFEHGKDLEIESELITIEGSALLKELLENADGTLSISSPKLQATQKLWLAQADMSRVETFDDIQGVISFGTKSFTFEGHACNNLFNLNYQRSFDANDDRVNITMSLGFDQWEGVSIASLPFFHKLDSLFKCMSEGWEMFTSLEVAGTRVFASKGTCVDKWEYVLDTASLLHYIACCRTVSQYFSLNIPFTARLSYTSDDHRKVSEVADIIQGRQILNEDRISSNPTCEFIVDDDYAIATVLQKIDRPITIQIVDHSPDEVEVFGERIALPSRVITLDNVLPHVQAQLSTLKKGDLIFVEWVPQDDFKCSISYKS